MSRYSMLESARCTLGMSYTIISLKIKEKGCTFKIALIQTSSFNKQDEKLTHTLSFGYHKIFYDVIGTVFPIICLFDI